MHILCLKNKIFAHVYWLEHSEKKTGRTVSIFVKFFFSWVITRYGLNQYFNVLDKYVFIVYAFRHKLGAFYSNLIQPKEMFTILLFLNWKSSSILPPKLHTFFIERKIVNLSLMKCWACYHPLLCSYIFEKRIYKISNYFAMWLSIDNGMSVWRHGYWLFYEIS